jgi:carbamoyltransferase
MKETSHMYILGISGNFYRASADPAAVLLRDGEIVAAAEEERFSRVKHAPSQLPTEAIRFCLSRAGISIGDVDILAFPQTTWRNIEQNLRDYFDCQFGGRPKSFEYVDHHTAHAASAYRLSGFEQSMILTADWTGDGIATTLSAGENGQITTLRRQASPKHSLGVYYGVMTQYLGFKKWEDEYKVMGLASYGEPQIDMSWLLRDTPNGDVFELDTRYLHETLLAPYPAMHGLQQPGFSSALVEKLGPSRLPKAPITDHHKVVAASVQRRLEEVVESLVRRMHAETGFRNLCIAGGVGLNCSMNGALLTLDCVDSIFVPPVANDSGLALGAAVEIAANHGFTFSSMTHASYGPSYTNEEIRHVLTRAKLPYEESADAVGVAAHALADNKIVGWFQGGMEFGPRALGNRSILADPRQPDMRDRINYYVKFREDFRPLAPSMAEECASKYITPSCPSPFMTITFDVRPDKRTVIPAVTHIDGTARVQTVNQTANPKYYELIRRFGELTGVPVVLNTSMNVMGDPIAMSPVDAIATFCSTGLDHLIIGDFVVSKSRL